jgi:hypothetical protein
MKCLLFFLILINSAGLIIQVSFAASNAGPQEVGVEAGFFETSLSPHGEWIEVEPGFRVWHPIHVSQYWRPYLLGQWVWTDYGWYWISSEPFGWITYHYGRWYDDDYYGWIWVPDDVWGPAWVEWRYNNDYIGWAPLPPYAAFNVTVGIRFTTHWEAPMHYWNFISYHHFGANIRYQDVAPEQYTRRFFGTTRSGSRYEVDRDRVINRGVDRAIIERHGSVRITRLEVRDGREQSGERVIRSNNNRAASHIEVYRPQRVEIQSNTNRITVRRGDRPFSIDMNKIERPRIESRMPSIQQNQREQQKVEEPTRGREIQRGAQQQNQPRENTPRVQENRQLRDSQTMRRELIQRYENRQNISPPVRRNTPQLRTEDQQRIAPNTRTNRRSSERQVR